MTKFGSSKPDQNARTFPDSQQKILKILTGLTCDGCESVHKETQTDTHRDGTDFTSSTADKEGRHRLPISLTGFASGLKNVGGMPGNNRKQRLDIKCH